MRLFEKIKRRAYYELDHIFRIKYHKYKYMSDNKCMKRIARWAVKKGQIQENKLQAKDWIRSLIQQDTDNSVTIVLEYQIGPRHVKLIKGLKNANVKVKVLVYAPQAEKNRYDKLLSLADECRTYFDIEELMYWVLAFKSYVVHYCTAWGECDYAACLLCHKSLFPTIVIERYDILCEMYSDKFGKYMKKNQKMERTCFEMADAICAREYSITYLKDCVGYDIPGRDIVFLDYVDNTR